MTTAVGIDVGKAALDLAIEGAPSVMRFANTKVGIGKLMARLGRLEEPRIVVEATGGYEEALLEACCDAGLWICRVNPRQAPDFLAQDFSRIPPGDYLVASVPYDEIEHVVDAVLPTREQARHLAMGRQEPCLLLQRRTWYQNETVTLVRCWHPASRYRLGSRFTV